MNQKNVIMQYFKNFRLNEAFPCCSDVEIARAIKNGYGDSLLLLLSFLQLFRDYVEVPIIITSGYRNLEHNKSVKGSSTSQHMIGQALDFKSPCMPAITLQMEFKEFVEKTPFRKYLGQVIFYDTFIHMALRCQSHKTFIIYDKRKSKESH